MAKAQQDPKSLKERRKVALSPELNEFLHMMKSLESELGGKPVQAS